MSDNVYQALDKANRRIDTLEKRFEEQTSILAKLKQDHDRKLGEVVEAAEDYKYAEDAAPKRY